MKIEATGPHPSMLSGLRSPPLIGVTLGLLSLALLRAIHPVLLALVCGVVIAILLDGLGQALSRRLAVSRRAALGGLLIGLAIGIAGLATLAGQALIVQVAPLMEALDALSAQLRALPTTLAGLQAFDADLDPGRAVGQLLPPFANGLTAFVAMFFIGAYLALAPHRYVADTARLLRPEARQLILDRAQAGYQGLRGWLLRRLARAVILTFSGGLIATLLAMPAPLPLAGLLGASAFLPLLGPALSTASGMVVLLDQGPGPALQAAGMLGGLHALVASRLPDCPHTAIPAGFLLPLQAVAWTLTGWMGVVLVAPILVAMVHLLSPPEADATRPDALWI